jgi:hypothetical protein
LRGFKFREPAAFLFHQIELHATDRFGCSQKLFPRRRAFSQQLDLSNAKGPRFADLSALFV